MSDPYENMDAWEFLFKIVGNKLREYGWSHSNPLLCEDVSVSNLGIQWNLFNETARLRDEQVLHDFDPTLNALLVFCKEKEEDLKKTFEGECFLKSCEDLRKLAPRMKEDLNRGFTKSKATRFFFDADENLSEEDLDNLETLLRSTSIKFMEEKKRKSLWKRFLDLFS